MSLTSQKLKVVVVVMVTYCMPIFAAQYAQHEWRATVEDVVLCGGVRPQLYETLFGVLILDANRHFSHFSCTFHRWSKLGVLKSCLWGVYSLAWFLYVIEGYMHRIIIFWLVGHIFKCFNMRNCSCTSGTSETPGLLRLDVKMGFVLLKDSVCSNGNCSKWNHFFVWTCRGHAF